MKKFYLLSLLVLSFCAVSAQAKVDLNQVQLNSEWTLYQDLEEFTIYYQKAQCEFDEAFQPVFLHLKFVNKTSDGKDVSWKFKFYNGDEVVEYSPDDLTKNEFIAAKSEKSGICSLESNSPLSWLVGENTEFLMVTHFELTNIIVE